MLESLNQWSPCIEMGNNSMSAPDDSQQPATLTSKQRTALISLLVDDDPAIYDMVRHKILDYGRVACEWLRPYMLSNDPAMHRRALEIVHHLARQDSAERFLDFCLHNVEELDLEQAMGWLA